MPNSTDSILKALDLVDRAIWVVSATSGGASSGLVATWVLKASLDAAIPKVCLSLSSWHQTTGLIRKSECFGVHLLRQDQADLAWRFGLTSGRDTDKFAGLTTSRGVTGTPLLDNCLAVMECRVWHKVDVADRVCIWAEVVAGQTLSAGEPLTEKGLLATATGEQLILLKRQLERDADRERAAWLELRSEHSQTGGK